MKTIEVKGSARPVVGKKSTRDIRKADSVPAVLYGVERGEDNLPVATHFTVTNDELRNLVYSPHIFAVDLIIDGKACKAVLKDIQFHPVTDRILHVDFYQVTEEKPIIMEVPVALEGLAEGVRAGGKLQLQMRKLKVKAIYTNIPEKLVVNVSHLGLGKTIKVGELNFEGLELVNSKDVVVCAVQLTRAARGAMKAQ